MGGGGGEDGAAGIGAARVARAAGRSDRAGAAGSGTGGGDARVTYGPVGGNTQSTDRRAAGVHPDGGDAAGVLRLRQEKGGGAGARAVRAAVVGREREAGERFSVAREGAGARDAGR